MNKPAAIKTKPEQIADYYQALIHGGQIPPGHKLPTVAEIAQTFGVARGTVIAAFRELDRRELVTRRSRSGVYARAA